METSLCLLSVVCCLLDIRYSVQNYLHFATVKKQRVSLVRNSN